MDSTEVAWNEATPPQSDISQDQVQCLYDYARIVHGPGGINETYAQMRASYLDYLWESRD